MPIQKFIMYYNPSENEKQERQRTYNVTSRHIHLTIVAVEKQ